jgi:hypothetical protein
MTTSRHIGRRHVVRSRHIGRRHVVRSLHQVVIVSSPVVTMLHHGRHRSSHFGRQGSSHKKKRHVIDTAILTFILHNHASTMALCSPAAAAAAASFLCAVNAPTQPSSPSHPAFSSCNVGTTRSQASSSFFSLRAASNQPSTILSIENNRPSTIGDNNTNDEPSLSKQKHTKTKNEGPSISVGGCFRRIIHIINTALCHSSSIDTTSSVSSRSLPQRRQFIIFPPVNSQ